MRALRTWHLSTNFYLKILAEILGISTEELKKIYKQKQVYNFDNINRLTEIREELAESGYKKEVELADERYIKEHRGMKSDEDWEEFWAGYSKRHNLPPYPKDAL